MWEEAVELLNGLDGKVDTKEKSKGEGERINIVQNAIENLAHIGIRVEELDRLNVIHVSGTKGKGSTCAYCESILRHKGYKTGFFSSPHIVEVRERIRLDGKPISKEKFGEYFLQCYRALATAERKMPNYFRFMSLMSFVVFLREKVDVAIIEVGIGGECDCTNIVKNPTVCGVASLGLDHTDLLGDTIAKIAWQKAGIFKAGVPAVTVSQKEEGMEVVVERAHEKGVPLYISKPLPIPLTSLGIPGEIQIVNASLALQLTNIWLKRHSKEPTKDTPPTDLSTLPIECPPLKLTPDLLIGLSKCFWPGRCQTLKRPGVTYYVDGAHTEDSIRVANAWFKNVSQEEADAFKGRVVRVLVFTFLGYRDAVTLMKELKGIHYDYILFTPPIPSSFIPPSPDLTDVVVTNRQQMERCFHNKLIWEQCFKKEANVMGDCNGNSAAINGINIKDLPVLDMNKIDFTSKLPPIILPSYPITHVQQSSETISFVMPSIQDSLVWLTNNKDTSFSYSESEATKAGFKFPFGNCNGAPVNTPDDLLVQVICLGSFYLAGGMLSFIDPTLGC